MSSSIQGLLNPSNHLNQGIANINSSVQGLPFLNSMIKQAMQTNQEFMLLKKKLEEKITELDKYIVCLKKYEKI